ncbi:MAG: hypothetical protein C4K58_00495 [Flavobacteriaceae bacterium]|nr:MAG: hypothetical protein C4K58_00495 [Flavobacteriaceae bacterium]
MIVNKLYQESYSAQRNFLVFTQFFVVAVSSSYKASHGLKIRKFEEVFENQKIIQLNLEIVIFEEQNLFKEF